MCSGLCGSLSQYSEVGPASRAGPLDRICSHKSGSARRTYLVPGEPNPITLLVLTPPSRFDSPSIRAFHRRPLLPRLHFGGAFDCPFGRESEADRPVSMPASMKSDCLRSILRVSPSRHIQATWRAYPRGPRSRDHANLAIAATEVVLKFVEIVPEWTVGIESGRDNLDAARIVVSDQVGQLPDGAVAGRIGNEADHAVRARRLQTGVAGDAECLALGRSLGRLPQRLRLSGGRWDGPMERPRAD